MRVVIAGDFPEQPPDVVGGIQAIIYYTLLRLADYPDLDIHVVSCEKWGKSSNTGPWVMEGNRWDAHYFPSSPHIPHTLSFMTVDRAKVRKAIQQLSPDIIHAHGQAATYPWAAFDCHIPTVITIQGINSMEARLDPRGGRFRGWIRFLVWDKIEKACLHRATDIVITGPFQANVIRSFTKARFHWIENPVQEELFQIPINSGVPGQILYVGSIQKRKGLADLIKAVSLLRNNDPQITLRVAGGFMKPYAEYGEYIRNLIHEYNLEDRIHLLGHLSRKSLLEELEKCSIFCLPTYLEGSPVAIAEAMAAGRSIVTTTIDSTSHLIKDGETGFRVSCGDYRALADQLQNILASNDLQYVISSGARSEAQKRFNPIIAAENTKKMYSRILGTNY